MLIQNNFGQEAACTWELKEQWNIYDMGPPQSPSFMTSYIQRFCFIIHKIIYKNGSKSKFWESLAGSKTHFQSFILQEYIYCFWGQNKIF